MNVTIGPSEYPSEEAYLPELRNALRAKFATLADADQPRFYGVMQQVRSAFEDRRPAAFIRALIAQVYIGTGGPEDEENRPDLATFQQELLNLPEWTV
jgi:hypothetical protein